jgi:adenylate cyclase
LIDSDKMSALINWLIAGAPPKRSFNDLVGEIGQRLGGTGVPVHQLGIYQMLIHPETPGRFNYWTKKGGARLLTITPQQVIHSDMWVGSPGEACMTSGRLVVHTLGQAPEYDERILVKKDIGRGYSQFVYTPLHSSYSLNASVACYGSKREGGFTGEEQNALRRLQAPLARVVEAFVLHEGTVQVLSTYVGRGAGERVLQGNILRGDTEVIPAIVLFADLKEFTELSNTQPARHVIESLNLFYDIAESAIGQNGGEILKFMGDGLLAIFPTPDDLSAQMAAASGAISSLEDIRRLLNDASRTELRFRASLHLGDIHYGNIGSKSRLDFTAIGPTVNLAARLMSAADELDRDFVCSEVFHHLVPQRTEVLGERMFKGFEHPHKVFGITQ